MRGELEQKAFGDNWYDWWLGPVRELRVVKQTRNEVLMKGKCGQSGQGQLVTKKEGAVGEGLGNVEGEQRSVTGPEFQTAR